MPLLLKQLINHPNKPMARPLKKYPPILSNKYSTKLKLLISIQVYLLPTNFHKSISNHPLLAISLLWVKLSRLKSKIKNPTFLWPLKRRPMTQDRILARLLKLTKVIKRNKMKRSSCRRWSDALSKWKLSNYHLTKSQRQQNTNAWMKIVDLESYQQGFD